jgi:hypothetical protein
MSSNEPNRRSIGQEAPQPKREEEPEREVCVEPDQPEQVAPATEADTRFALEPVLGTLRLARRNIWLLSLEESPYVCRHVRNSGSKAFSLALLSWDGW